MNQFLKKSISHYRFVKAQMQNYNLALYNRLVLDARFLQQIQSLGKISTQQGTETGGFIVQTGEGLTGQPTLRIIEQMIGDDREINLEPQSGVGLKPGEKYLGTFHCHPITPVPSVHDVLTFVAEDSEKMMIVHGVDGTINLLVKTSQTKPLPPDQVEAMKDRFPKGSMKPLVDTFNFAYYAGKGAVLGRVFTSQPIGNQTVELDDIIGQLEGSSSLPAASKKTPKKA